MVVLKGQQLYPKPSLWTLKHNAGLWPDLHDERCARGDIWLLGLQLTVGVVKAVPRRADHVDHIGMDHREVSEASRGNAQHAEVVVERRSAVFDLDALFFVIHGAAFSEQQCTLLEWQCAI